MKILSVNNTADIYGASRCMERVLGRFVEDGHEVHAVLPQEGPLVAMLEARGIRVHIHRTLPIVERSRMGSLRGCARFFLQFPFSVCWLAVLILRLRIDIVHTNIVVLPTPAFAAFIARRPHVWHIRELLGEFGWMWIPYQRYIMVFSRAAVAISCCVREQFEPALQGRVHVIYDGLDEAAIRIDPARKESFRKALPPDRLLVGVLGRIKWHRKGQEVLVRAASLLTKSHPCVHYVLIGSVAPGNEVHETKLRALISDLGLGDAVTLYGETDDPMSVLAALDIAVVPSVQPEPFGCVVIESMAAGTPVIGSRCGGIAEQIVPDVSGILFPPGDFQALASGLDRLFNDALLRNRLVEQGLRRVREDFPLEDTYRSMLALFETIGGLKLGLPPQRDGR
jgi:glycosyltransferase involved in cell wall biosynthesis